MPGRERHRAAVAEIEIAEQPACGGAHGSTRNVVGSATITMSAAPSISFAETAAGREHRKRRLCEVSLATIVVVMEQPFRARQRFAGDQRLAAQDAVLVWE